MVWRTSFEFVVICAAIGALSPSPAVLAQKIVVDATPTHFVNAFSPIRALGAGVDRLRAGEGAPEIDRERIEKGLWLADYVGSMMTAGASGTFYFHYIPTPGRPGPLLMIAKDYRVVGHTSQYLAAQMIAGDWVQPVDATHQLFRASSDIMDASGNILVTAYPMKRPDGSWSVMLVNKDRDHDHAVRVIFRNLETRRDSCFSGPVVQTTLGQAQYQWHPDGEMGHTEPDGPPLSSRINGRADTLYQLPKASLTVLRGDVGFVGR
jgi:hypothetical protein